MPPSAAATSAPAAAPRGAPVAEMLRLLLRLRWWVALLIGTLTLLAAAQPSVGWMGKAVIEGLKARDADLAAVLAQHGLAFALLFIAIAALKIVEKLLSVATGTRLVIVMQRTYLDRRRDEQAARDVSQVLYGSEVAKKGFEVLYKDVTNISIKVTAIAIWQLTLAPEWLPVMLLSILPGFAVVWWFGAGIRSTSRDILGLQSEIAGTTARTERTRFAGVQERLFRRTMWFELLKAGADELMDLAIWISAILLIAAGYWLDVGLLPTRVEPGELALVAINLKLLSDPLGHVGKAYTKWQEAVPAVTRVFRDEMPQTRQSVLANAS